MNRKLQIAVALSILSCTQLSAQGIQRKSLLQQQRLDPITRSILQKQASHPAQRGTVMADRLIGYKTVDDRSVDSARYIYNGNTRGSELDNNVLESYMDFLNYPLSYARSPYPIDLTNNGPSLKFDTAYFRYEDVTNYSSTSRSSRIYSGSNLISQDSRNTENNNGTQTAWHYRTSFSYDASGNLTVIQQSEDTSVNLTGLFSLMGASYSMYNGNKVTKDSIRSSFGGPLEPQANRIYTYNTSGNLINVLEQLYTNNSYQSNSNDIYTYANGKLYTHMIQYYSNGLPRNNNVDTFKYQNNNLVYQSTYYWSTSTNNWDNGMAINSYYNTQGNLDSQLLANVTTSGSQPAEKATYTYNAYNHYSKIQYYNFGGFTYNTVPDAVTSFYYETYNATAIHNGPVVSANKVRLYPNPAKESLNIQFENPVQGAVTARIYNALGQLVQATQLNAASLIQVPVVNLVPGNYVLEVSNNNSVQHLPFVKQ